MNYAAPGSSQTAYLLDAPTGLTGTLTFRIFDANGADLLAATTTGISEFESGSYARSFTAPTGGPAAFFVEWANGTDIVTEEWATTSGLPGGGAYATVSHVKDRNPTRQYPASTGQRGEVTASMVVGYLVETAAVLDGILVEQRYQLPIATTATQALKLLEHYNAIGAWSIVERASVNSSNESRAEALWDEAQKMLRDGLVLLPDAPRDADTAYARTPASCATPAFFPGQQF